MIDGRVWFDPKTIVPDFEDLGHKVPLPDVEALQMLIRAHKPEFYVEIGSFVGHSAVVAAHEMEKYYTRPQGIWCVDTWEGSGPDDEITEKYKQNDVFGAFLRNTAKWRDYCGLIEPVPQTSQDASKWVAHEDELDMVFIDGDHSYEAVCADIRAWWPKLREGGVLCGHDFLHFPGVTKAAFDFGFDGYMCTVWWRIKGRPSAFEGQKEFEILNGEPYSIGAL